VYRKQVRRRRAILVTLVVACLMLISISISEADSGPLHSVQSGISSVLAPVGEGADRALKPIRDLIDWFDETWAARGDNKELRAQVADLRDEVAALRRASERAGYEDEVAKLVERADGLAGLEPVDATVVGRSFSVWYGKVTIDAGRGDGVAVDDAVITQDGLVGRVSEVRGGTSTVVLITDGESAVTARVVGKGPVGLVTPVVGSPGRLEFSLIQGEKEVAEGDTLVTAGFSSPDGLASRYPAGIPIGKVIESSISPSGEVEGVRVEPFAKLAELDHLTVLTRGDGGEAG
jgi:rod shape-determining protein MreC